MPRKHVPIGNKNHARCMLQNLLEHPPVVAFMERVRDSAMRDRPLHSKAQRRELDTCIVLSTIADDAEHIDANGVYVSHLAKASGLPADRVEATMPVLRQLGVLQGIDRDVMGFVRYGPFDVPERRSMRAERRRKVWTLPAIHYDEVQEDLKAALFRHMKGVPYLEAEREADGLARRLLAPLKRCAKGKD